jgi:hypothetical protein
MRGLIPSGRLASLLSPKPGKSMFYIESVDSMRHPRKYWTFTGYLTVSQTGPRILTESFAGQEMRQPISHFGQVTSVVPTSGSKRVKQFRQRSWLLRLSLIFSLMIGFLIVAL